LCFKGMASKYGEQKGVKREIQKSGYSIYPRQLGQSLLPLELVIWFNIQVP